MVVEYPHSTGGSVLEAVAAAKRERADVLGVVEAIFSYQLKADKTLQTQVSNLRTLNYNELIHPFKKKVTLRQKIGPPKTLLKKIKKIGKCLKHRKIGSH